MRNLRPSNCWKCIEIVNSTTTTLILYHFEFFTIPSGGPIWLLGDGVASDACAPRAPPCLRACRPVDRFGRPDLASMLPLVPRVIHGHTCKAGECAGCALKYEQLMFLKIIVRI